MLKNFKDLILIQKQSLKMFLALTAFKLKPISILTPEETTVFINNTLAVEFYEINQFEPIQSQEKLYTMLQKNYQKIKGNLNDEPLNDALYKKYKFWQSALFPMQTYEQLFEHKNKEQYQKNYNYHLIALAHMCEHFKIDKKDFLSTVLISVTLPIFYEFLKKNKNSLHSFIPTFHSVVCKPFHTEGVSFEQLTDKIKTLQHAISLKSDNNFSGNKLEFFFFTLKKQFPIENEMPVVLQHLINYDNIIYQQELLTQKILITPNIYSKQKKNKQKI